MRSNLLTLLALAALIIAACKTSRTTMSSAASTAAVTPAVTTKPKTGINPPGDEELAAMQVNNKDMTLNKLMMGYTIYTAGECIKCHNAKNIYNYTEVEWMPIMNDMARRARLSDEYTSAVYSYVLSVKATQKR